MTTITPVDEILVIKQPEAQRLGEQTTQRMVELLGTLAPEDWEKPTECALWDVRAMAGHVLGMTETFTSFRRFVHTMRTATKEAGDGLLIDAITALQVRENASLTTDQVITRMRGAGPRQAKWRGRRRLVRHTSMKQPMPDGTVEKWHLGFLFDIVLTRDTWMHRVDIARATGRELVLTPDVDGRVVSDAVADWARRHGKPFTLMLTGPAGGTYAAGEGGESIELDAVEFCRILSGRAKGDGLLTQDVPF